MNFNLIEDKDRAVLNARSIELEKLADKLSKQPSSRDPLQSLSEKKRAAYREVFGLIYECSQNGVAAKSLVDRILSRISKS